MLINFWKSESSRKSPDSVYLVTITEGGKTIYSNHPDVSWSLSLSVCVLAVAQVARTTRGSGRSGTTLWFCCGKHRCMKEAAPSPDTWWKSAKENNQTAGWL